jgi:hypothetical protein
MENRLIFSGKLPGTNGGMDIFHVFFVRPLNNNVKIEYLNSP